MLSVRIPLGRAQFRKKTLTRAVDTVTIEQQLLRSLFLFLPVTSLQLQCAFAFQVPQQYLSFEGWPTGNWSPLPEQRASSTWVSIALHWLWASDWQVSEHGSPAFCNNKLLLHTYVGPESQGTFYSGDTHERQDFKLGSARWNGKTTVILLVLFHQPFSYI